MSELAWEASPHMVPTNHIDSFFSRFLFVGGTPSDVQELLLILHSGGTWGTIWNARD